MTRKTIRIVALVFAMLFMLCACNGEGAETTPADTTTAAPDTTTAAPDTTTAAPDDTTAAPAPVDKTLRIMSFNLQCGIAGTRDKDVIAYLMESGADSIGTQEAGDTWINRFKSPYSKNEEGVLFRDMYAWVGDGRDSNKRGERCTILYRKDKFDLVESGTKWISDTPDEHSKMSGSEYYRIFTYAILKDKVTGEQFMHINTHLDTSGSVRRAQAERILELAPSYADMPTFFTGDFNCGLESETYTTITGSLGFVNAAKEATTGKPYSDATHNSGSTIDYIFIPEGYSFTVDKFDIYTQKSISDHKPIYIDVTLP